MVMMRVAVARDDHHAFGDGEPARTKAESLAVLRLRAVGLLAIRLGRLGRSLEPERAFGLLRIAATAMDALRAFDAPSCFGVLLGRHETATTHLFEDRSAMAHVCGRDERKRTRARHGIATCACALMR